MIYYNIQEQITKATREPRTDIVARLQQHNPIVTMQERQGLKHIGVIRTQIVRGLQQGFIICTFAHYKKGIETELENPPRG